MKLMKRGQVGNLQGFILAIVSVAIVLAVGLIVLGELQSGADTTAACNQTSGVGCNQAWNSTGTIITKLATVPTWIGIIITVSLAFIVLGYFFMRRG